MIVGVDAGGVAVGEGDLNGVVADRRGGLRAGFGFEHGQRGKLRRRSRGELLLLVALFVARGAGAVIAKVGEVVMAGVAVSPGDIHAGAGRDVDFDVDGFAALVERKRHGKVAFSGQL